MSDADILFKPATELATLVRAGEVSSRELVERSLARIEAVDGEVNAFTIVVGEQALAAADTVKQGDQRPFAGVPICIKDLSTPTKGIRMSQCSDLVGDDYVPQHDNNVVRRLKEAGFIVIGLTASPEFGILPVTESRRFGPTRNPWDPERTPGGSSGGTAAAVAAAMVPVGHGSDGGGSIRIPATCCGLVGLKPSRGRISKSPDLGEVLSGLVTDGVLTRTVDDTARLLDILEGYEPGDPNWIPGPDEPFAETAHRKPNLLRIAVTTTPPLETDVDSEWAQAAHDTAELLSSLGHSVEEATPDWVEPSAPLTFTQIWASGVAQAVFLSGMLAGGKQATEADVEPLTWALTQMGNEVSAVEYLNAELAMHAFARRVVGFWSDYDVLVTPGLAKPQVKIGEIDACSEDPMSDFASSALFTPFTPIFNMTGQPAIGVPFTLSASGLPIGVQLAGPPGSDDILLQVATQLEQAKPWAGRRPDLSSVAA